MRGRKRKKQRKKERNRKKERQRRKERNGRNQETERKKKPEEQRKKFTKKEDSAFNDFTHFTLICYFKKVNKNLFNLKKKSSINWLDFHLQIPVFPEIQRVIISHLQFDFPLRLFLFHFHFAIVVVVFVVVVVSGDAFLLVFLLLEETALGFEFLPG